MGEDVMVVEDPSTGLKVRMVAQGMERKRKLEIKYPVKNPDYEWNMDYVEGYHHDMNDFVKKICEAIEKREADEQRRLSVEEVVHVIRDCSDEEPLPSAEKLEAKTKKLKEIVETFPGNTYCECEMEDAEFMEEQIKEFRERVVDVDAESWEIERAFEEETIRRQLRIVEANHRKFKDEYDLRYGEEELQYKYGLEYYTIMGVDKNE